MIKWKPQFGQSKHGVTFIRCDRTKLRIREPGLPMPDSV
ncbi:hypothetical protein ATPR_1574 [Acetobacter tropicalis NBRC 101654]|uniref:Uncharacterized protein n=1 Tax=Acetobacter tropicalis NBRC 101654 TaxID=749388 RepID=F7VDX5_9PROT|nr:hypothetical protein ATPR_1574 [Acetobacter tropicalis NBRC 101654]